MFGLAILIGGALVLNELRAGLVTARIDSLRTQGELIANVIDAGSTSGDPEPSMDVTSASAIIDSLFIARNQRARLFNSEGLVVDDSLVTADHVDVAELPPARKAGERRFDLHLGPNPPKEGSAEAQRALAEEVGRALRGETSGGVRISESGKRVVSVSIPIMHVREVLGVLTIEAGDIDEIVAKQRAALIPFILIAIGVTLLSSLLLTQLVAQPVLRLARAADRVRLSRSRAIALPDLARRDDELGDLTRSLEDMTSALSERMEAIERFAADVAHEIRNPMTSIRSAVETLELVKDQAPRDRLLGILKQDIGRLDRLVTDISNASRLDAELARDTPRPLDLTRLLTDLITFYEATARPQDAPVVLTPPPGGEPAWVSGREGPLQQVFRNLVDNARSFSPPDGQVRIKLERVRANVIATVDDDGPGMPVENLETVFERFYTSRPKGAAFGGNSGLGLSIARQIVDAHGGLIHAENRMEGDKVVGARFVVTLPAT